MGVCLSCLGSTYDDNEIDERTSLINHGLYSNENYQEELVKQQQRQNELNTITKELSDTLIDVSTFSSKKLISMYPKIATEEEKSKMVNDMNNLDVNTKEECRVESNGPLYLNL